ncbi:MAG: ABC transporter permease [Lachnospiraceae bacterium]|nr:ABC transporter permease [Lachnospiraceae bacterium]
MGYSQGWKPVVQERSKRIGSGTKYYEMFAAVLIFEENAATVNTKTGSFHIYQVEEVLAWDTRFAIPEKVYINEWNQERQKGARYLVVGQVNELIELQGDNADEEMYEAETLPINWFYINTAALESRQSSEIRQSVVQLSGSLEEFLNSENGAEYQKMIEHICLAQSSSYVVSTDCVESILSFNQEEAFVKQGRVFNDEEYQNGSRVCLMSEEAASVNGLSVGDSIPLSLYQAEYGTIAGDFNIWYVRCDPSIPFTMTESAEYEIIGIYRAPLVWGGGSYELDLNTIFIPTNSLTERPEQTETTYGGEEADMPVGLYTFLIPNGQLEEFQMEMEQAGYRDAFLYYDQGYSYLDSALKSLREQSRLLLIVCTVVWSAVVVLYLLFGVLGRKKELGMLLAFGAGKKRAFLTVMLSALLFLVPASWLGCVLAGQVERPLAENLAAQSWWENKMDYLFSDLQTEQSGSEASKLFKEQTVFRPDPGMLYRITGIQGIAICIGSCGCGIWMVRQKPAVMGKEE